MDASRQIGTERGHQPHLIGLANEHGSVRAALRNAIH